MILIIAGSYTLSNVQHACHHLLVILLLLLHVPQHLHLWPLSVSLLLHSANDTTLLSHLLPLSSMYLLQLQLPRAKPLPVLPKALQMLLFQLLLLLLLQLQPVVSHAQRTPMLAVLLLHLLAPPQCVPKLPDVSKYVPPKCSTTLTIPTPHLIWTSL